MLAYLIAISILNILLGYALAVYLMRASQSAEFAQRSMEAAKRVPASLESSGAPASTSTPAGSVFAHEPARDANAIPPARAATATEATSADVLRQSSEETDAQLLAGIADFRSQLAKLRSSTAMEAGSPGFAASER